MYIIVTESIRPQDTTFARTELLPRLDNDVDDLLLPTEMRQAALNTIYEDETRGSL